MKFGKMKTHRRNQLILVVLLLAAAGGGVGMTLMALNENINLFYSPAQIVDGDAPTGTLIRAGGMVKEGSVVRSGTDLRVSFVVSDLQSAEYTVHYDGILPDLFREGQGVIARGELRDDGEFMAQEVLAKHDENYMPPEVADVINEAHARSRAAGAVPQVENTASAASAASVESTVDATP
jgi:cytochrome c-type biogenesis protein CcmE